MSTRETNPALALRADWAYPTVLPYSLKVYPIVQTAPEIEAPRAGQWPWAKHRSLAQRSTVDQPRNQIYLHVPFCPFLCHFCPLYKVDTPSSQNGSRKDQFVEAMLREIRMYGRTAAAGTPFHSVYFGGGTPTELTPTQLGLLLDELRDNFDIAADAEITLEGVARQMLQPGYLAECYDRGFNRISFGAQSLDPEVRKLVGRGDSVSDYPAVIELSRSLNPNVPVNLEIMAGTPGQSLASLERDVQLLMDWAPDSLDVLYYVMMHGTKLVDHIQNGTRPSPAMGEELLAMRRMINETIPAHGYHQVTAEAFARSDRDLFADTSFGGGGEMNTVLALGPSAFGLLEGTTYHNVCDLKQYLKLLGEECFPVRRAMKLTRDVAQMRRFMLSLVRLQLPEDLVQSYRPARRAVRRWLEAGLVAPAPGGYELTETGKLWYNHMQMEVLPHKDRARSLRMFGSIDEQRVLLQPNPTGLRSHEREMWLQMRSEGRLRFWLYRMYHWLHDAAPFLDRGAIGFTGPRGESRSRRRPAAVDPLTSSRAFAGTGSA
jgi:oxygen-independent coproporphyrinogen-3 oxidase